MMMMMMRWMDSWVLDHRETVLSSLHICSFSGTLTASYPMKDQRKKEVCSTRVLSKSIHSRLHEGVHGKRTPSATGLVSSDSGKGGLLIYMRITMYM